MKGIAIFFFFLFLILSADAQTDVYRFSRIDIDHGLSNNQIKTVLKDRHGFLWVGTVAGLNRYDGYNIKVFSNHPGDSTSLINSEVNKVFEGPGGKLWIHTWSGINVYDPLTETFDRNTNAILSRFSIPPGQIIDIKKDRDGNFWFIHATQGLYRYSETTGETTRLVHATNDSRTISSNQVTSLANQEGEIETFRPQSV